MSKQFHGFPYKVILKSMRDRVQAMAAVRRWRPDLTMQAAKSALSDLPFALVEDVSKDDATRVAHDMQAVGVEAEVVGPDFNPDPVSWLLVRTTVEEQERDTFGQPGGLDAAWTAFKAEMQTGDEVWTFSSPAITWQCMVGRAGLALLRDGKIVSTLITVLN